MTFPIPRHVARFALKSAGGDSGNRTRDRGFAVRVRVFVSVRGRPSRTQIGGARAPTGRGRPPRFAGVAVSGAVSLEYQGWRQATSGNGSRISSRSAKRHGPSPCSPLGSAKYGSRRGSKEHKRPPIGCPVTARSPVGGAFTAIPQRYRVTAGTRAQTNGDQHQWSGSAQGGDRPGR